MSSKSGALKNSWNKCLCFFMILQGLQDLTTANKCLKNGLYEHPTDCNKFYSCASYGPVLMNCPVGLHFSPNLLQCDWPEKSGCKSNEEDLKNKGTDCPIYPDTANCSRFYSCSPSGHILMDCPPGLHFNSKILVCDWPENAKCFKKTTFVTDHPQVVHASNNINITTETKISNNELYTTSAERVPQIADLIMEIFGDDSPEEYYTTNSDTTTKSFDAYNTEKTVHTESERITTMYTTFINNAGAATSTDYVTTNRDLETTNIDPDLYLSTNPQFEETTDVESEVTTPIDLTFFNDTTDSIVEVTSENIETTTQAASQTATTNTTMLTTALENTITEIHAYNSDIINVESNIQTSTLTPIEMTTMIYTTSSNNETEYATNTEVIDVLEVSTLITLITPDLTTLPDMNMNDPNFSTNDSLESDKSEITTEIPSLPTTESHCPIYADLNDCTKFYVCSSTGPILMTCPVGLYFNSKVLVCDWSKNSVCASIQPADTTMSYHTETTTTTNDLASTTEMSTVIFEATTQIESESISNLTTENENIYATEKEVSTTITNNFSQSDDPVDDTNTSTTLLQPESTTNQLNDLNDVTYSTSIPNLSTNNDDNNAEICSSNIWPHPGDCKKFYMATPIGNIVLSCPKELLFDPVLLVCDLAANVACTDSSQIPIFTTIVTLSTSSYNDSNIVPNKIITEDIITDQVNSDIFGSTESETTTTEQYNTTKKLVDLSSHLFHLSVSHSQLCNGSIWPHATNCAKFFMCDSTGPIEMTCPEELLFNPALLVCDRPKNFKCWEELVQENASTFLEVFSTPLPENNAEITTEANLNISEITTDYPVTQFSIDRNEESTVTIEMNNKNDQNIFQLCKGSIWPHPTDCSKYFMCDSTGPIEMICPKELLFNPATLVCDWPKNFECQDLSLTENSFSLENAVTKTSHRQSQVTSPKRNTHNVKNKLAKPNEICTRKGTTYFLIPHPDNCRNFLICDHGTTYISSCPGNYLFNKALNACVAFTNSDNVNCFT